MEIQQPKGVRDFMFEEKILRDKIVETIKNCFEIYGFNPIETPALERYDVLASKYAGGSEILKETFKLTDQGKRKLGLRYDLTVPLARLIAMNPMIKLPFKRYQIGNVWRDGPIKLGRYREFLVCDADIVGAMDLVADVEILSLAEFVFDKLGIDVEIEVNNIKLLREIMECAGIEEKKVDDAIISIDKLKKIGKKDVENELIEKGIKKENVKKIFDLIETNDLERIEKIIGKSEGIDELKRLLEYAKLFDLKRIKINPALARGLSYYTGTIFEVYVNNGKTASSVAAGGRYDKMIGIFARSDMPAVGIGFGIDVILDEMKVKKIETKKSLAKLYVVPINMKTEAIRITKILRDAGINTDMDLMERGITKNLEYANSYQIPYVLFVGEEEVKKDKYKLKDMRTGKEEFLTTKELIDFLKEH